jgi:hypothetical protein
MLLASVFVAIISPEGNLGTCAVIVTAAARGQLRQRVDDAR